MSAAPEETTVLARAGSEREGGMGELIPRAWTPIAYRVDGGEWVHYSNHIQVTPDVRLTVDVAPAYERAEWLDVRTRAVGGGRKELYEVRAARAEART